MAGDADDSTRPASEVDALIELAGEVRALREAYAKANKPEFDVLDAITRISGGSPKAQRERAWLESAIESNRLATVAIWVAALAAIGSVLTAIATLITVL